MEGRGVEGCGLGRWEVGCGACGAEVVRLGKRLRRACLLRTFARRGRPGTGTRTPPPRTLVVVVRLSRLVRRGRHTEGVAKQLPQVTRLDAGSTAGRTVARPVGRRCRTPRPPPGLGSRALCVHPSLTRFRSRGTQRLARDISGPPTRRAGISTPGLHLWPRHRPPRLRRDVRQRGSRTRRLTEPVRRGGPHCLPRRGRRGELPILTLPVRRGSPPCLAGPFHLRRHADGGVGCTPGRRVARRRTGVHGVRAPTRSTSTSTSASTCTSTTPGRACRPTGLVPAGLPAGRHIRWAPTQASRRRTRRHDVRSPNRDTFIHSTPTGACPLTGLVHPGFRARRHARCALTRASRHRTRRHRLRSP